jgi:phosphoglycolate phosphatase-like HAD superfamily hydrolase
MLPNTNDPLPSWREGPARRAIERFVETITSIDDPGYVPPPERVAVFDNDGTLWCEKPMYIQLDFALRRLAVAAAGDASLRERQPWKAAYEEDHDWLGGAVTRHYRGDDSRVRQLLGGIMKAFEGMTVEEFDTESEEFLRSAAHPTLDRPYLECAYRPMVELVRYLGANGFAVYIASGGGRDFMRPVTQEIYGVPRERVIGSGVTLRYVADEHGGTVVREAELEVLDDGPVKPTRVWSRVGRRPILAAGNSDGDIELLRFAEHPLRPSLSLLVYHDDAEREFAYDAGAEKALEQTKAYGWTVVSMKNDWASIFVNEMKSGGAP